jgi:hypothetical protein
MSRLGIAACLLFAASPAITVGGCSTSTCHAGCLCNTTPDTCPGLGCYAAHETLPDGGVGAFFCSNGPPLGRRDAGPENAAEAGD